MIKQSDSVRVGEFIKARAPLFVPKYQRTYAWETEEIDDFIGDLKGLHEARLQGSSPTDHFFGGLVIIAHVTATGMSYEVVDGQQRLATVFMTTSRIAEAYKVIQTQAKTAGDEKTTRKIEDVIDLLRTDYLKYKEETTTGFIDERMRLRLSYVDDPFFGPLINGQEPTPNQASHERMLEAANRIWEQLLAPIVEDDSMDIEQKLNSLHTLRTCLYSDCYLLQVISDDRNEAYRLFAVLNDRGKTLSDGDLLRWYSLELLEGYEEQQNRVVRCWDETLSGTPSEIDHFLRSYYPSHTGKRAPKTDLSGPYRKQFFGYSTPLSAEDASAIERRVNGMKDEIAVFRKIVDGLWPYEDSTVPAWNRDRLSRLTRVLKHTLCTPLLLSAHNKLDEEQFSQIVTLLERFIFRYITVMGARPSFLYGPYYEHAEKIRKNSNAFKVADLASQLRELLRAHAADEQFKERLQEVLTYDSPQRIRIRYFLSTLEDHYKWFHDGANGDPKPDRIASFDLGQIDIEHIYARNARTVVGELEGLKDNLGNLTFWAPNDNRSAGNKPFDQKKEKYAASTVRLTRELGELENWNATSLKKRQSMLVKMALKVFVA